MAYNSIDWQMNDVDWNDDFDFGSFVNFSAENDVLDAPFGDISSTYHPEQHLEPALQTAPHDSLIPSQFSNDLTATTSLNTRIDFNSSTAVHRQESAHHVLDQDLFEHEVYLGQTVPMAEISGSLIRPNIEDLNMESRHSGVTDIDCDCIVCRGVGTMVVSLNDQNHCGCRFAECGWLISSVYQISKDTLARIIYRGHEKSHFRLGRPNWSFVCQEGCRFWTDDMFDFVKHHNSDHKDTPGIHFSDINKRDRFFVCVRKGCDFSVKHIDQLHSHYSDKHGLSVKNGENRYFCHELQCSFTSKRWSDLIRHYSAKHCTRSKKFSCPVLWCKYHGDNNGFSRKDKMQSHMSNVHKGNADQKKARGRALAKIQPKKQNAV